MSRAARSHNLYGYLLVAPFLFFLVTFVLFPLADLIYVSFLDNSTYQFAGFSNFAELLNYPSFQQAITNTILYVSLSVNIKMLCSLLLANTLALVEFRGKRIYRAIVILPWVLPFVPAALDWRWLLDSDYGLVNQILPRLGLPTYPWLTNPQLALGSIIFVQIWTTIPLWSLFLLSGMQQIPISLYEAAKIDGASSLRTFRFITMPMIKRLYVVCLLLATLGTMGDFVTIWIMTGGGPNNSTQILATAAYREAFILGHFPLAASMFVVALPVLGLFVFLVLRLLKESP